jgi:spore coat polysaccharide biosynthesis protein SpsF
MSSERLPGKPLLTDAKGVSLLSHVLSRVSQSTALTIRIVAMSTNPMDERLLEEIPQGFLVRRGHEHDVLQRFLDTCAEFPEALIVRICADNPFIGPNSINDLVEAHLQDWETVDYYSYLLSDGTPAILTGIGLFAETVKLSALRRAKQEALSPADREHVTRWLYTHPERFACRFLPVPPFIENVGLRLTVDTAKDMVCFRAIVAELEARHLNSPTAHDLVSIVRERTDLSKIMAEQDRQHRKV